MIPKTSKNVNSVAYKIMHFIIMPNFSCLFTKKYIYYYYNVTAITNLNVKI